MARKGYCNYHFLLADTRFLTGPQYIAITLAWDRRIESTGGTTYNEGDQFLTHGVANLDLALMKADGTDLVLDSVSTSQTFEDNVEHIFFKFDASWITGFGDEYKIVVHHQANDIGNPLATTNYALAWWYGNAPPSLIPGDYDGNGSVGPEDFNKWKADFGTANADSDGNGNGIVDAADYNIWRDNLGAMAGSGSLASVPEPSGLMLVSMAGLLLGWRRYFSALDDECLTPNALHCLQAMGASRS